MATRHSGSWPDSTGSTGTAIAKVACSGVADFGTLDLSPLLHCSNPFAMLPILILIRMIIIRMIILGNRVHTGSDATQSLIHRAAVFKSTVQYFQYYSYW